ncbi:hypothetical protein PENTCL1PPCAC_23846, partial [Pristionchus entomophagus]
FRMPPRRKKEKKEEVMKLPPDSKSGIIRFNVDKVSMLDDIGLYSAVTKAGGVPWIANIYKDSNNVLRVFLECLTDQSTHWRIDVDAEYILVNSDSSKNAMFLQTETFDLDATFGHGDIISLMSWNDVMDEEKGFIKDDRITIEIRFSITNIKGIRIAPRIDFTDPNELRHDITLVIGGEKIYANKAILAVHSPYFNAMFYGNFADKDKKEIELKDVDREEFLEMLYVIHPSCKKISDDSAEYLLKLGDLYQITGLVEQAEKFIIKSGKYSNLDKLRLADQYRLFGLQHHCLCALKTTQDFHDVNASLFYKNFSDATKAALYERHLKIVK